MCGIVGGIGVKKPDYKKIIASISHRGPDSNGFFSKDNFFMCHTRLSIQDVSSKANQPMFSNDKRYVIVFNGEIYNHNDIRKSLDYDFKSSGDTETVLASFIKYGPSFLKLLNGIFSLAIFDSKKNELFFARDHLGVKPLYIYKDSEKFLFSSEIKSFLNFDIDKKIDFSALVNYLTFLWSPGNKTPFEKVKKITPGSYAIIKLDNYENIEFKKYYTLKFDGKYFHKSEDELIDILDTKLQKAVKRQMLSDVPIGFFLSGGLDSSLIVAIAKKINPKLNLECFTIDDNNFKEGFVKDIYYAKKVAKYLNVNLNVIKSEFDIVNEFDKMIWHLDEPQADPAPLHVFNISLLAKKKGIKVLLGGTGGDDIFSGYRRHKALNFEKIINFLPKFILLLIKKTLSIITFNTPFIRRLKKLIKNIDKTIEERIVGYFGWLKLKKIRKLLINKDDIKNYNPYHYLFKLLNEIPKEKSYLNKILFLEQNTFLPDHNLNYTDKMSMATGIETRVPFLDIELIDFSKKIPPNLKMKGKETKYILKKVAERYLPKDIIYRSKTGFGAPVRKWILKDMSKFIDKRLSNKKVIDQRIFNYNELKDLIKKNKNGKIDASYSIWSILAINSWFNQFVNQNLLNDK